jgi:2-polyprenyl-3-methyl-5-hydroxy-6-metoxy-1,4-benzoquinol methylase
MLSARLAGRVRTLTAFDIDPACVRTAEARLGGVPAGSDDPAAPRVFQADLLGDLPPLEPADLVVCCEVLEHVPDPEVALDRLHGLTRRHLIASVPREPLWRALNMARLKYLPTFGNTPGHIQHWSSRAFVALMSRRFRLLEVRRPLPWTMILAEKV